MVLKQLKLLNIGDVITFGKYQVNTETPADITWIVVAKNHPGYPANSVTLMSEKGLDILPFDAQEPDNPNSSYASRGNPNYNVSNIHQYLNSTSASPWFTQLTTYDTAPSMPYLSSNAPYSQKDGFLYNFTEDERNAILTTSITTTHSTGLVDIDAKVFLPSIYEVGFGYSSGVSNIDGTSLTYFSEDIRRSVYMSDNYIVNKTQTDLEITPTTQMGRRTRTLVNINDSSAISPSFAAIMYVAPHTTSLTTIAPLCNLSGAQYVLMDDINGNRIISQSDCGICVNKTSIGDIDGEFTIEYSLNHDTLVDIEVNIKLDDTILLTETKATNIMHTYTFTDAILTPLSDGDHTIYVYGVDDDGKIVAQTISFTKNSALQTSEVNTMTVLSSKRNEDGTYTTYFPITTSDSVYTDIENNVTLTNLLRERFTDATLLWQNYFNEGRIINSLKHINGSTYASSDGPNDGIKIYSDKLGEYAQNIQYDTNTMESDINNYGTEILGVVINNKHIVKKTIDGTTVTDKWELDLNRLRENPGSTVHDMVIDSSNRRIYIAINNAPYLRLYEYSANGELVFMANPDEAPAGVPKKICTDTDMKYICVAHETSPFITVYQRSGSTLTKLPNPVVLPSGTPRDIAIDSTGTYVAVLHDVNPFVSIYKFVTSGGVTTIVKQSDLGPVPSGIGNGISFGGSDHLVVSTNTAPFIKIYKRTYDAFNELPDVVPNTVDFSTITVCRFDPSGEYLYIAFATSPHLVVYKVEGDTFTRQPAITPIQPSITNIAFNSTGTRIMLSRNNTPYMSVFDRTGDVITAQTNPAIIPSSSATSAAVSPNGQFYVSGHSSAPFIALYERVGNTIFNRTDTSWSSAASRVTYGLVSTRDGTMYIGSNKGVILKIPERDGNPDLPNITLEYIYPSDHNARINSMLSYENTIIATSSAPSQIYSKKLIKRTTDGTGDITRDLTTTEEVTQFALSPDNSTIYYVTSADGIVKHSTDTLNIVGTIPFGGAFVDGKKVHITQSNYIYVISDHKIYAFTPKEELFYIIDLDNEVLQDVTSDDDGNVIVSTRNGSLYCYSFDKLLSFTKKARIMNLSIIPERWIRGNIEGVGEVLRYDIYSSAITPSSMVNINIRTITGLNIANAAGVKSIVEETMGRASIYSAARPAQAFTVDVVIHN